MASTGWTVGALLLLAFATAAAQMSSPPVAPCTWTGTSQVACSGTMEAYDVHNLLSDMLDAGSASSTVSVRLSGVNMTGQQLAFLKASAYEGLINRSIQITVESSSIISKNQFVIFGALASQAGLQLDLQVLNSQVLDNQFVVAAGIVSGGAGTASLNTVNSEVRGNMLSTAGALAMSGTAQAMAAGTGGSATRNVASAAALIASGGAASATGSLSGVPVDDTNGILGTGLAFTEDALVTSVVSTVMNAVFVDSSTLPAGLATIQNQLCSSMTPGGSLYNLADQVNLDAVLSVALSLLCDPASASSIKLSDIPGMVDGTASPGAMATMRSLGMLATGKGHLKLSSVRGALSFLARHPGAAAELRNIFTVKEST